MLFSRPVCARFNPETFTGRGSEGVKAQRSEEETSVAARLCGKNTGL